VRNNHRSIHDDPHPPPSPLGTLKAFEAAARHQSLVRAAEELHVTHGAVSRQIQALEDHLGERLFERRNRGIFLTDRGKWLSLRLMDLFAELTGMFQDFHAQGQPRPLIVSCEPTLCLRLMIPALADLRHETGLDVRFLAAGGPIDFRRDHVDLAIRRNDFTIGADLFSVELAEEWMGPVMARCLARPGCTARPAASG
jgi:DNA-binding transcriptional LysR family regulator